MPPKKKLKPLEGQKTLFEVTKTLCQPAIASDRGDAVHALPRSGDNNTDSQASANDTGQTGSQASQPSASTSSSTPCVEQTETQLTKYP